MTLLTLLSLTLLIFVCCLYCISCVLSAFNKRKWWWWWWWLSDLAKYSMIRSTRGLSLCDSWASCIAIHSTAITPVSCQLHGWTFNCTYCSPLFISIIIDGRDEWATCGLRAQPHWLALHYLPFGVVLLCVYFLANKRWVELRTSDYSEFWTAVEVNSYFTIL